VVGLGKDSVRARFARAWNAEYETRFNEAKSGGNDPSQAHRPDSEKIDEILTVVRGLAREGTPEPLHVEILTPAAPSHGVTGRLRDEITRILQPIFGNDSGFLFGFEMHSDGRGVKAIRVNSTGQEWTPDLMEQARQALANQPSFAGIQFEFSDILV
jgi:hypothetical protein